MKREVQKIKEEYVKNSTFEASMQAVAKSFADQKEILELMLKEIRNIHDDNKNFRTSISV